MAKWWNSKVVVDISEKREIEITKELQITIKIPKEVGDIKECLVLFNQYGHKPCIINNMIKKENTKEDIIEYCAKVVFSQYGNYYFFFLVHVDGEEVAIKINRETKEPFFTKEEAPYWKILVIQDNFEIPKWAKDAIYYQLVVDRFYKSQNGVVKKQEERSYRKWGELPEWRRNDKGDFHNNDFFGGNIKGIEEKLDYFKSLNVGVIYISPINKSSLRYERYASTNHMEIDLDVGTFEELKSLHEKANDMNIHLVLDVAFNHCSSDNPIFQEALNDPNSKYRNWFYFEKNNNYRCWYGEFKDMPIFNQENKEVQEYFYGENGVVAKFAKYVDGFRLDVAEELKPFFLEGIRNKANQYGKHLIIAEYWQEASAESLGKDFDGLTNYMFANAILKYIAYGESEYLKWQVEQIEANYPRTAINAMLNSLDTHDMVRSLTILGGKGMRTGYDRIWDVDKDPSPWHVNTPKGRIFLTEEFRKFEARNDCLEKEQYEYAKKLLKLAVLLQYFLPGNPCIFYGTEVGIHGYKDPFNRKCFPWDNMDQDLLEFYREVGRIKKQYVVNDKLANIIADEETAIVERGNVWLMINRTNQDKAIQIPEEYQDEKAILYLNATKEILHSYGGIVILK